VTERPGSNRAAVFVLLALIGVGEAYAGSRWIDQSPIDRAIGAVAFLASVVTLAAFVWRVPRATPTAPWLFRPQVRPKADTSWPWLIVGASGAVTSALLPFGAEVALAGLLAGLGFALLILGGVALARGHVR
jgi:hypothetical protein